MTCLCISACTVHNKRFKMFDNELCNAQTIPIQFPTSHIHIHYSHPTLYNFNSEKCAPGQLYRLCTKIQLITEHNACQFELGMALKVKQSHVRRPTNCCQDPDKHTETTREPQLMYQVALPR